MCDIEIGSGATTDPGARPRSPRAAGEAAPHDARGHHRARPMSMLVSMLALALVALTACESPTGPRPGDPEIRLPRSLTADELAIIGAPAAYVCQRFTCRMPVVDREGLRKELDAAL